MPRKTVTLSQTGPVVSSLLFMSGLPDPITLNYI